MRLLSLYSGVGGMDLGAHIAGIETVAFCEADPWNRRVLRRHWPTVPIYENDETLTSETLCSSWPTMTGAAGRNRSDSPNAAIRPSLEMIVKQPWPTFTTQDGENDAGPSQYERNSAPLNVAVVQAMPWSTPQARDGKGVPADGFCRNSLPRDVAPGLLNPDWVEALAGLPIGWTSSEGPSLLSAFPPRDSSTLMTPEENGRSTPLNTHGSQPGQPPCDTNGVSD